MYLLVVVVAQSVAQDMKLTEVHGHVLGESLKAYVARTPHGEEQVQKCRIQLSKQKRPDVRNPLDFGRQRKRQAFDECAALVEGVDAGGHLTISAFEHPGDQLTYDADRLVKIQSTTMGLVNGIRFENVVAELAQRWGSPYRHDDLVTQNGFGATFHHRRAIWEPGDGVLYIETFEADASLDNPKTIVTIATRQEHQRDLAAAVPPKALE